MRRFFHWLVYQIIRLSLLACTRLEVEGRQHLPAGGPLLVIGNHFSLFDGPLLYICLPYRPLVFLAASDLVDRHHLGWLVNLFDAIPVRRGEKDRDAIEKAKVVLDSGKVLGILPEGAVDPVVRNAALAAGQQTPPMRGRRVPELVEPRPGAAMMAVHSGAPILPVGIIGAENILGNVRRLRRTPVRFVIGPVFGPLSIDPDLPEHEQRARITELSHQMMHHVAPLLPPGQRGPYQTTSEQNGAGS